MAKIDPSPFSTPQPAKAASAPQAAATATPWSGGGEVPVSAPVAAQVQPPVKTVDVAVVKPASLGDELEAINASIARAQAEKAKIIAQLAELNTKADDLVQELEKYNPVPSVANTIQAYHQSQQRLRDERASRLVALRNSGVDFKALLEIKAPIDNAMSRKTGRGGQRPTGL